MCPLTLFKWCQLFYRVCDLFSTTQRRVVSVDIPLVTSIPQIQMDAGLCRTESGLGAAVPKRPSGGWHGARAFPRAPQARNRSHTAPFRYKQSSANCTTKNQCDWGPHLYAATLFLFATISICAYVTLVVYSNLDLSRTSTTTLIACLILDLSHGPTSSLADATTSGQAGSPPKRKRPANNRREGQSSTPEQRKRSKGKGKGKSNADTNQPNQQHSSDTEGPRPSEKPRRRGAARSGLLLACPFCKSDPDRHRQCFNFSGSKLSYVKQHIYRCHEKPYCAACMALFDTIEARDAHSRQQRCQVPFEPVLQPGYITLQQKAQLQRRGPSDLDTIEGQWYYLFDIVCPGEPRPASPYNDFVVVPGDAQPTPQRAADHLSPGAFEARDFLTSNSGMDIILGYLRRDQAWFLRNESRLREGITRGVADAFSVWAARPTSRDQSSQNSSDDQDGIAFNSPEDEDRISPYLPLAPDHGQPGPSNWDANNTTQLHEYDLGAFDLQQMVPELAQVAAEDSLFDAFGVEQILPAWPANNLLSPDGTDQSRMVVYSQPTTEAITAMQAQADGLVFASSFPTVNDDDTWLQDFGQF